jgi:small-conductance mechanosensitive channel
MPFQQRKAKSRLSKRHLSGTLMARPRYLGNVCLGKIKTDKMKALRNLVPFCRSPFRYWQRLQKALYLVSKIERNFQVPVIISRKTLLVALTVATFLLFSGYTAMAQSEVGQVSTDATTIAEEREAETAPVIIDGAVIFTVRSLPSIDANERASRVESRITTVAEKNIRNKVNVTVEQQEAGPVIMADDALITYIFASDAEQDGVDIATLSALLSSATAEAISNYRIGRTSEAVELGVKNVILWTLGYICFLVSLIFLRRLGMEHSKLRIQKLVRQVGNNVETEIDTAPAITVNRMLWNGITVLTILISFYYFVALVLHQFAFTKTAASILLRTIASPMIGLGRATIDQVPNFLTLFFIILISRYVLKLLRLTFRSIETGVIKISNFEKEWVWPTHRIIRTVVIVATVVVCYPYIPGSSSTAFQGMSILLGVLVSFGANSISANIIGGLIIIYKRGMNIGDRIMIDHLEGDVERISLLDTQIRSIKNEMVSVPNAKLLSNTVINYSQVAGTTGLKIHTTVGIGYEEPREKVERVLIDAAAKTDGVKVRPGPFILRTKLGSSDVKYQINAYLKMEFDPIQAHSEMIGHILDAFRDEQIQIMTPFYVADPEAPKIPPPRNARKRAKTDHDEAR